MAAPIQRVWKLASKTFARFHPESPHIDRLAQLKSAFNEIKASDVNFDADVIRERDHRLNVNKAPVSYIHLWEDDIMSMGIFVLKSGGRLPFHDHPGMFGLIKVIYGSLKVVSLTEVDNERVPDEVERLLPKWQKLSVKSVRVESEEMLTPDQECCQLTPSSGNLHQITTETDIAAFVDILAPPYDHSKNRDCNYYSEIPGLKLTSTKDVNWIMRVPQPMEFWCDSLDYTGPNLDGRFT